MFTQVITQIAQQYANKASAEEVEIAIKNVEKALNLMSEGFFPLNFCILKEVSAQIYSKLQNMFAPADKED